MCTAYGGRVRFEKIKKKSQLFENWNDAYVILMLLFATCK